jgi:pyrimidine-nucleoside phosphorylase
MIVAELIERKRNGEMLSATEWGTLVARYVSGEVPDYQMAALCMAVYFRGLHPDELVALTDAMLASGSRFEFESRNPHIDKHSTGGVGDKVSLVLAPLVAACGVHVPMICGRGLGHTGGTIDKLEAIPGFRTDLGVREACRQVDAIGCALVSQSTAIAPADRRLYALRDVTGTVSSIPLIATSIMSKKLAEGLSGLVLDVKRGSGAFLSKLEDGIALAQTMITLGASRGCPAVALVTAMDRPLGWACGNALEAEEAVLALRGEGPPDLLEVVYALGAEMLTLAGVTPDLSSARRVLEDALTSGRAAEKFAQIVDAQGGNPAVVDDPALLPQGRERQVFRAPDSGYVSEVEPRTIGLGIVAMGGGRRTLTDTVDLAAGMVITAKPGQPVERGDPIATVFGSSPTAIAVGTEALRRSIVFSPTATTPLPLVSHRVSASGVEVL